MSSLKLLSNYSTALNKKIHLPLWLNFFVKSLIEAVYRTLIKINFNGRKTKMKIDQKHFIKLTFSQQPFLTIIPISNEPAYRQVGLRERNLFIITNKISPCGRNDIWRSYSVL